MEDALKYYLLATAIESEIAELEDLEEQQMFLKKWD